MIIALTAALAAITFVMGLFALVALGRRRSSPLAFWLGILLAALSSYAGLYAFELNGRSLAAKFAFNRLQYLGISFLPPLWILFTARYANIRWLKGKTAVIALFSLSLVTLFGAATDPWFALRYSSVALDSSGPIPVIAFTWGPLYWVHICYSLTAFTLGTVFLFRSMASCPRFFVGQLVFMLVGSCLPWVNYVMYLSGVAPWGIDTIPFSMFLSAACFGTAIFGYRILDVSPVARALVFETMIEGAIVTDPNGKIVDFNGAAAEAFPELSPRALSRTVGDVFGPEGTLTLCMGKRDAGEFAFRRDVSGVVRSFVGKTVPVVDKTGVAVGRVCTFRDNTDSVLLVEKLQELATVDPLTRLYNRRYFLDQSERQLNRLARGEKPVSILMLDLDHFKKVNDSRGHAAGDEVLKGAAAAIASLVRCVDVVARYGGEEFACLLPETAAEGALLVANRICEKIRASNFRVDESRSISISISVGVRSVSAVGFGDTIAKLLADADAALYGAKKGGRDRVVLWKETVPVAD